MTVETPPGVLNGVSTDAKIQRRTTQALAGGEVGSFAGGAEATNGAAHGVCGYTHLAVSQSGTPGMSVDVAAGIALITGTVSAEQGPYSVYNDAAVTLSIAAADATNDRRDLVIAQVRDSSYSGADDDARLTVVTGTPDAAPVDPSLASYPNALVLARVAVAANDTAITNGEITDLRTKAGDWARPWGRVGSAQSGTQQTGITTVTDITNAAVAFTRVAGRRYRVTGEVSFQQLTNLATVIAHITDGSNTPLATRALTTPATYNGSLPLSYEFAATVGGSYTVKLRIESSAASVTSRPTNSLFNAIYVDDIGPI